MTREQRFAAVLTKLIVVFRGNAADDDVLVETYWEALREWPIEALEAGACTLIRESRFFPRPVEWADAAEDWLRERRNRVEAHRLALRESNEPALTKAEVQQLIADLTGKLGA